MKNREKYNHTKEILEIVELGIAIQNKGIGTVMIEISGHITDVDFRIYAPVWIPDADSDCRFSLSEWHKKSEYMNKINLLKEILNNGEFSIPGFADKKESQRQKKLQQLEKLKIELQIA